MGERSAMAPRIRDAVRLRAGLLIKSPELTGPGALLRGNRVPS